MAYSYIQRVSDWYNRVSDNTADIDRLDLITHDKAASEAIDELQTKSLGRYRITDADTGRELSSQQYAWLRSFLEDFHLFQFASLEPATYIYQRHTYYSEYSLSELQQLRNSARYLSPTKTVWKQLSIKNVNDSSSYLSPYQEIVGQLDFYDKDHNLVATMSTLSLWPVTAKDASERIHLFHGKSSFYPPHSRYTDVVQPFSITFDADVPLR